MPVRAGIRATQGCWTALVEGASSLGAAIFRFTSEVAPSRAVRQRRIDIAGLIDEIALSRSGARILSVACGHLREAELSSAVRDGAVSRLVAFDQDAESLAIASSYGSFVEPRHGNVRELLRSRDHDEFDLVYAAGLFDYLDQRTAARLAARLFERLRSGGELIVPKFRTGIWEAPYLSVFMNWQLLYRTDAEIAAFASELPTSQLAESAVTIDATGCIGTLRVRRG